MPPPGILCDRGRRPRPVLLRSPRSRPLPALPLLALVGVVGGVLGLSATNPDPQAFETFAGQRLATLLHEEFCGDDGLPMLARLLIRDCPGLVASQSGALGRIALDNTRRRNALTLRRMSQKYTEGRERCTVLVAAAPDLDIALHL